MLKARCYLSKCRGIAGCRFPTNAASRAQAALELAIMAPILMIIILVGVQFAIIGVAALGLGQIDFQGARYAAINVSATQSQVQSYMLSAASPLISAGGGKYLTVTLSPAPPCTFGGTVTVAVTFDVNHLIMLPNPFMGLVSFPGSLSNSQSAFCE